MTISSNYTNYNYTNYQSSTDVVSLSIHIVRRLETQFVHTINPWIASLSSGHSSSWSSCSICGSCWLTNLCCVLTQVACWRPGVVIFKCAFNLIEMFLLLTNELGLLLRLTSGISKCSYFSWDCRYFIPRHSHVSARWPVSSVSTCSFPGLLALYARLSVDSRFHYFCALGICCLLFCDLLLIFQFEICMHLLLGDYFDP